MKLRKQDSSDRIRTIHSRVQKVKANEEIGVKYMQAWEEKYYEKEEGLKEGRIVGQTEGREHINKLIKSLSFGGGVIGGYRISEPVIGGISSVKQGLFVFG